MKKIVNELICDIAQACADNWSDAKQIELADQVKRICRRGIEHAARIRREAMIALPNDASTPEIKGELIYEYDKP